jgi:hypothetical protein
MARRLWTVLVGATAVIALGASDCSSQCVSPPCALPRALLISVTSAAGEPITGASAEVSGAVSITPALKCNTGSLQNMCIVGGGAGTYDVRVSAPGFQAVEQSIVVTGSQPLCGCGSVDTRMVTIALAPQR